MLPKTKAAIIGPTIKNTKGFHEYTSEKPASSE